MGLYLAVLPITGNSPLERRGRRYYGNVNDILRWHKRGQDCFRIWAFLSTLLVSDNSYIEAIKSKKCEKFNAFSLMHLLLTGLPDIEINRVLLEPIRLFVYDSV